MAEVVFRTSGDKRAYLTTVSTSPFALSNNAKQVFITTTNSDVLTKTNANVVANFVTNLHFPIAKTPANKTVFVVTANPNDQKNLKLKIGTITMDGTYTSINVPDATGPYNELTNQGGYNVLPAPYDPTRPYRENVSLWTLYRIWDVYGETVQFPVSQPNEHLDPYSYQLFFPTTTNADGETEIIRGIYEIILIAAPYFNETDTNGFYKDDTSDTYYIVRGLETNFTTAFVNDQFLYFVGSDGSLYYMNTIYHIFSDTILALNESPNSFPASGMTICTSATELDLLTIVNAVGKVQEFLTVEYTPINGDGTTFETTVSDDNLLYYIDPETKDYIVAGKVYEVVSDVVLNLYEQTENIAPAGSILVTGSPSFELELTNSNGTFLNTDPSGIEIEGLNTEFTLFEEGQYLYYSNSITGELVYMDQIATIIDDTHLTLVTGTATLPFPEDYLFSSATLYPVLPVPTNGALDSYGTLGEAYALVGDFDTDLSEFNVDDYVYVVSPSGVYSLLGQVHSIYGSFTIRFSIITTAEVEVGDSIIGSPNELTLIYPEGVFDEYETGTYYNIEGDSTEFLTTAEPNKFLFYLDSTNENYVYLGQVFLVFDDTNIWMLEAPEGAPDVTDKLYTSWTLNTETALYENYRGKENIIEIADQFPGWFIDTVGMMIDDNVNNCLNRKRYDFVKGIMCGVCSDNYLPFYAKYVAMNSAIEIQEWQTSIDFYNQLKSCCLEEGCSDDSHSSCGC